MSWILIPLLYPIQNLKVGTLNYLSTKIWRSKLEWITMLFSYTQSIWQHDTIILTIIFDASASVPLDRLPVPGESVPALTRLLSLPPLFPQDRIISVLESAKRSSNWSLPSSPSSFLMWACSSSGRPWWCHSWSKTLPWRQKHLPKDNHLLMPRTCEYVLSQGRRDFPSVIKLRTLKWVIILDYMGGPLKVQERSTTVIWCGWTWTAVAGLQDRRRNHEPKKANSLQKLGRQGNRFLAKVFKKEGSPADTLI